MPAAELPPLNINELNFDTSERLRHLDWLLAQLGLSHGARILDVGGYPGYMARAFPHWNVVTIDTYAKGHPPYVKGSGAELPFKDGTFDATIACDVLEHVPPQYREAFLKELSRVTSSAVIVAGPYDTPGTASAEKIIRGLLPPSSPAQAWLAEHDECGLPSLHETLRAVGPTAAGTGVVAAGSLTGWVLFFAAQAAGESSQQVGSSFQAFLHKYNCLIGSNVSDSGLASVGPAYRHAVVAANNAQVALKLSELQQTGAADEAERANVEDYIASLGRLLQSLHQSPAGAAAGDAANNSPELDRQYMERLELMLANRGLPVSAPAAHSDSHPTPPIAARIKQAMKVLLGRP